ncbi:MAG: hypothetical protein GX847_01615 [Clostridiales bacterium]|nr:hypothetical protein [Clostridiales bacterium]
MEICRKNIVLGENKVNTLVYFVTIDDLTDTTAGIILESYGVGVTICESGESSVISNVTFSGTGILELINLLADHLVTPVTVCDIIDDWLCAV